MMNLRPQDVDRLAALAGEDPPDPGLREAASVRQPRIPQVHPRRKQDRVRPLVAVAGEQVDVVTTTT